jgi:hypothetical protein
MLAKELKACKSDLVRFYDIQKKSGVYPSSLVKRRLDAIDEAIQILQGEKDKPGIQNTLF